MRLQGPWVPALVDWLDEHGDRVRRRRLRHLSLLDVVGGIACARRAHSHGARSDRARRADAAAAAVRSCCSRFPTRSRSSPRKRPRWCASGFPARRRARCSARASTSARSGSRPRSARFRERFGLGDRPYLVVVGRLDPGQGLRRARRLLRHVPRAKSAIATSRSSSSVSRCTSSHAHPDIVVTGFVDERDAAGGGRGRGRSRCNRRTRESFSLVLAEAWAEGKPALVQRGVRGDERAGSPQRWRHPVPRLRGVRGRASICCSTHRIWPRRSVRAARVRRGAVRVGPPCLPRYERVLQALAGRRRRRRQITAAQPPLRRRREADRPRHALTRTGWSAAASISASPALSP